MIAEPTTNALMHVAAIELPGGSEGWDISRHRDEIARAQLFDRNPCRLVPGFQGAVSTHIAQDVERVVRRGADYSTSGANLEDLLVTRRTSADDARNLDLLRCLVQREDGITGCELLDRAHPPRRPDLGRTTQALVLCGDAGEVLPLGRGDAELLVGRLHLLGQVVP